MQVHFICLPTCFSSCSYSPEAGVSHFKAPPHSPHKVNYNQLRAMSPPHVPRERGTGGRLLWAFKDPLHYTIQLLFIRQCTAINQTGMFCYPSSGTKVRWNLFRFPVCLEKTLCNVLELSTCYCRPGPACSVQRGLARPSQREELITEL